MSELNGTVALKVMLFVCAQVAPDVSVLRGISFRCAVCRRTNGDDVVRILCPTSEGNTVSLCCVLVN